MLNLKINPSKVIDELIKKYTKEDFDIYLSRVKRKYSKKVKETEDKLKEVDNLTPTDLL